MNESKIDALKLQWRNLLPSFEVPSDSQFHLWLHIHGGDLKTVIYGIEQTALKHAKGFAFENQDHVIRFASSCANAFRRRREKTSRQLEGQTA